MKRHISTLALMAALAAASGASAATFEFSYTYSLAGGSHVMKGTFDGIRNSNGTPLDLTDDYLETPTVLSASFDNVPMISSPLVLRTYDDTAFHDSAVDATNVYFAASANNFIISPCQTTVCLTDAYANNSVNIDYFFLRTLPNATAQYYSELNPLVAYNDNNNAGVWLLKEVSAVPEPASYALFLSGMAVLLGAARRRSRI